MRLSKTVILSILILSSFLIQSVFFVKETRKELESTSEIFEISLSEKVDIAKEFLKFFSAALRKHDISKSNQDELDQLVLNFKLNKPLALQWSNFLITDNDLQIISSAIKCHEECNLNKRDYASQLSIDTDQPIVGEPVVGVASNSKAIPIVLNILDGKNSKGNVIIGLLLDEIIQEALNKKSFKLIKEINYHVADNNFQLHGHSSPNLMSDLDSAIVLDTSINNKVVFSLVADKQKLIMLYMNYLIPSFILMAIALLSIVFHYYYKNRLITPINQITAKIKEIDQVLKVPVQHGSEQHQALNTKADTEYIIDTLNKLYDSMKTLTKYNSGLKNLQKGSLELLKTLKPHSQEIQDISQTIISFIRESKTQHNANYKSELDELNQHHLDYTKSTCTFFDALRQAPLIISEGPSWISSEEILQRISLVYPHKNKIQGILKGESTSKYFFKKALFLYIDNIIEYIAVMIKEESIKDISVEIDFGNSDSSALQIVFSCKTKGDLNENINDNVVDFVNALSVAKFYAILNNGVVKRLDNNDTVQVSAMFFSNSAPN